MDLGVAAASFALVVPAELPDKTFIASLVLSTRGRPLLVWSGVALAFAVHVAIAVTAGGLFALLPHRVVSGVVAALFAGGALWCLTVAEQREEDKGTEAASSARSGGRVLVTAFVVIFAAEWGDLTQIVTAQLAARFRDPFSVAVGAAVGLWIVAALAVGSGQGLLRLVPLTVVRRVTGLVLGAMAVLGAVNTIRG